MSRCDPGELRPTRGKVVLHLHPLVHLWKDDTFRQFLVKSQFVVITNDDRQTDSRQFLFRLFMSITGWSLLVTMSSIRET